VVAVALLALAFEAGLTHARARGLVWALGALASFLVLRTAALVVHPDQPIQATTPWSIKGTFLGMFCLYLVATAMVTMAIPPRAFSPDGG
jgi:hypothetical protein